MAKRGGQLGGRRLWPAACEHSQKMQGRCVHPPQDDTASITMADSGSANPPCLSPTAIHGSRGCAASERGLPLSGSR